jgi:hypothetical protein
MTSVVGVSFGGLFDPWQQKELMLAQLKVNQARTLAGQDKALQDSSALHDKFLLDNAKAEAKEREALATARSLARTEKRQALAKELESLAMVRQALVDEVQRVVEAETHKRALLMSIDEDEDGDLDYWWSQLEKDNCL